MRSDFNVYHRRKWKWQPKFKSWSRLFVFHMVLRTLGKVKNPYILLPLPLPADWAL